MTEDRRLLREYVESGSRKALEELIQHHLGLVYASALRQVRDPNLAEDVTQAAFLILTQRARTIRDGVAIGGWLLSVTRCIVVTVMRKQATKQKHERLAARPEVLEAAADDWKEIAPVLDAELNRLGHIDRDAVVLRFFQDRSFAEIGLELGFSEEAARKRVGRALERVRARLNERGASLSSGALGLAMGAYAMQAAPSHLSAAVTTATFGGAVPHGISLAKGAIDLIAWTKAKLVGAVAASILMGSGAMVVTESIKHQQVWQEAATSQSPAPAAAPATAREPAPAALVGFPQRPAPLARQLEIVGQGAAPAALPVAAAMAAPPSPAAMAAEAAPASPAALAAPPAPAGPNGHRGNEMTSPPAGRVIS